MTGGVPDVPDRFEIARRVALWLGCCMLCGGKSAAARIVVPPSWDAPVAVEAFCAACWAREQDRSLRESA